MKRIFVFEKVTKDMTQVDLFPCDFWSDETKKLYSKGMYIVYKNKDNMYAVFNKLTSNRLTEWSSFDEVLKWFDEFSSVIYREQAVLYRYDLPKISSRSELNTVMLSKSLNTVRVKEYDSVIEAIARVSTLEKMCKENPRYLNTITCINTGADLTAFTVNVELLNKSGSVVDYYIKEFSLVPTKVLDEVINSEQ